MNRAAILLAIGLALVPHPSLAQAQAGSEYEGPLGIEAPDENSRGDFDELAPDGETTTRLRKEVPPHSEEGKMVVPDCRPASPPPQIPPETDQTPE